MYIFLPILVRRTQILEKILMLNVTQVATEETSIVCELKIFCLHLNLFWFS